MDDGTARSGGSDAHLDQHLTPAREAVPATGHNAFPPFPPLEKMRFPWSPPSAPSSPTSPPASPARAQGHRRTLSGSILSRFNFLRADDEGRPPSEERPQSGDDVARSPTQATEEGTQALSPVKDESAMASALKQSKTARKRKGSLRKTALLGGRRFVSDSRERRNSFLQRSPQKQAAHAPSVQLQPGVSAAAVSTVVDFTPSVNPPPAAIKRQFSYESHIASSSSDSILSEPPAVTAARLSLVTAHAASQSSAPPPQSGATLSSPLDLKSPVSQASTTDNTTDDDEILTFDRPAGLIVPLATPPKSKSATASASYFPNPSVGLAPTSSLSRSKSRTHRPSPLSHPSHPQPLPSPPPSDSTSTSTYGYILLATTWIIFTIGMGSCLEVWSWAWDVGETPYAPPELEDDPTLPIVGYYPALIVLTAGVVSWVWVAVAWVGMKYFRHAKIEV